MFQILSSNMIQASYSFVIVLVLSLALNLKDFGSFGIIAGLATLSLTAMNCGVSVNYIYKVARNNVVDSKTLNIILSNKILLHLPVTIIVCLTYAQVVSVSISTLEVLSITLYVFCLNIQQIIVGEVTSLKQYTSVLIYEILFKIFVSLGVIISYLFHFDDIIIIMSIIIAVNTLLIAHYRKMTSLHWPSLSKYKCLVRESSGYFLNSIMENIYWRAGMVLAPLIMTLEEVGKLQINITTLIALNLIPLGIIKYIYPNFGTNKRSDTKYFLQAFIYIALFLISALSVIEVVKLNVGLINLDKFIHILENGLFLILISFFIALSRLSKNLMAMNNSISMYNSNYIKAFLIAFVIIAVLVSHNENHNHSEILIYMLIFEIVVVALCIRELYDKK